jgi:hypothetical protein
VIRRLLLSFGILAAFASGAYGCSLISLSGLTGGDAGKTDGGGGEDANAPLCIQAPDGGYAGYAGVVVHDGPLAYWRLDDAPPSGEGTAHDLSGHCNNALYFGVTQGPSPPTSSYVSALFEGTGYVQAPQAEEAFAFPNNNAFTIEAWVNPRSTSDYYDIAACVYEVPAQDGYLLFQLPGGGLEFQLTYDKDTPATARVTADGGGVGQFTYVAAVYNGTQMGLYVNGVLQGKTDATLNIGPGSQGDLIIGAESAPILVDGGDEILPNGFRGSIAEVAIYGYALTEQRIAAHYQAAP